MSEYIGFLRICIESGLIDHHIKDGKEIIEITDKGNEVRNFLNMLIEK